MVSPPGGRGHTPKKRNCSLIYTTIGGMSLKMLLARCEIIKFNNKVPLSIHTCELRNQV